MLENFIKKYDLLDQDFCDEIVLNHKTLLGKSTSGKVVRTTKRLKPKS
jgi:hypothetical protein